MEIGTKVQLLHVFGKNEVRKYLKGIVTEYNKTSDELTVKIDRCPRKFRLDLMKLPADEVVPISNESYAELSFVDFWEKVRITQGEYTGNVGEVCGYNQDIRGRFTRIHLNLRDLKSSYLSVPINEVEIISNNEYYNTFIQGKRGQLLMF